MTVVGVHEETTVAPSHTKSWFPLDGAERVFVSRPISAQDLVSRFKNSWRYIDAGLMVVWSFKPHPTDVQNGSWRQHVIRLAEYIRDNSLQGRVVIVIWHEPENDVPKWFKSPEEFVSMFNTVHDWIKSVDPSIQTCHAALGYRYADRIDIDDKTAKRWVTKADIHAIDLYSGRSFPLNMTMPESSAFNRWKASRPKGARWAVSERGWIADAASSRERASSINAEADWLSSLDASERPEFYIVWNTPGTENDPKLVLDDAARAAVNELFARLRGPAWTDCPLCEGAGKVTADRTYVIVR